MRLPPVHLRLWWLMAMIAFVGLILGAWHRGPSAPRPVTVLPHAGGKLCGAGATSPQGSDDATRMPGLLVGSRRRTREERRDA